MNKRKTQEEITKIIELHEKWLKNIEGGEKANLSGSDLSGSDLSGSDLSCSDLSCSNLRGSDLSGSNLRGSDLSGSNLSCSDLSGSNLSGSNLRGSDLSGSNLSGSNLSMAKGLKDKYEFLKPFESKQGYIVYKVFNGEFPPNPNWKIEPKSIIEEVVNPLPTLDCACGINVASLEWVEKQYPGKPIWKCLIRWKWAAGIVVPYNTDGKFRCDKLELVEVVEA